MIQPHEEIAFSIFPFRAVTHVVSMLMIYANRFMGFNVDVTYGFALISNCCTLCPYTMVSQI